MVGFIEKVIYELRLKKKVRELAKRYLGKGIPSKGSG